MVAARVDTRPPDDGHRLPGSNRQIHIGQHGVATRPPDRQSVDDEGGLLLRCPGGGGVSCPDLRGVQHLDDPQ